MKQFFVWMMMCFVLAACAAPRAQTPESAATSAPQVSMPNPASAYCIQHGGKLEIRTAADGSQNGVCSLPDGSTCDEWAYFRGECGAAGQNKLAPTPANQAGADEKAGDWRGVIKSMGPGGQFDDYFERQDQGQTIACGIDAQDPAVQAQIKALRDSGKTVHVYGKLLSNVPDANGMQIQVERIVIDG
jgi:uncharacterized protein